MSCDNRQEAGDAGRDDVRVRLDIAYDGTRFHGWAVQKDSSLRTVQAEIEKALALVVREPVRLTVAGRTDKGVHATGQVAHVDVPRACLDTRSLRGEVGALAPRLSKILPVDIVVTETSRVSKDFDARFSALTRSYTYRVTTSPTGACPTRRWDTARWGKPIDLSRVNAAASQLVGLHDFAAFSKFRPGATTVRDLRRFEFIDASSPSERDTYEATVEADAFTWQMVRSLVGACLAVGDGSRSTSFPAEMLSLRTRSSRVPVAPGNGLTLSHVSYPPADQLADRARRTRGIRVLPGEEHRAVGKGCPRTNPYFDGV